MPEFYNEKIKIGVLLAPPMSLAYNDNPLLKFMAIPVNENLIMGALDTIKFWNIVPYNFWGSKAAAALCGILDGKVCDLVFDIMT